MLDIQKAMLHEYGYGYREHNMGSGDEHFHISTIVATYVVWIQIHAHCTDKIRTTLPKSQEKCQWLNECYNAAMLQGHGYNTTRLRHGDKDTTNFSLSYCIWNVYVVSDAHLTESDMCSNIYSWNTCDS